jgi:hypothetical protein
LSVRHVVGARDFNMIAGIDAKTPGMLSVIVEARGENAESSDHDKRRTYP